MYVVWCVCSWFVDASFLLLGCFLVCLFRCSVVRSIVCDLFRLVCSLVIVAGCVGRLLAVRCCLSGVLCSLLFVLCCLLIGVRCLVRENRRT